MSRTWATTGTGGAAEVERLADAEVEAHVGDRAVGVRDAGQRVGELLRQDLAVRVVTDDVDVLVADQRATHEDRARGVDTGLRSDPPLSPSSISWDEVNGPFTPSATTH